MGLALIGCAGSSMPVGGADPTQLTYQLTPVTGAVNPGSVEGDTVEIMAALGSNSSELPTGFTGVQGMHFYPALPPDSGFTGTLNVRLSQIATGDGSGYDGSLLYLYYMNPATGEANFVDSARANGDWVNFQVSMLGYFVVAENDAIQSSTEAFAAFAFADTAAATVGAQINFWAIALNGSAPYTFEWWMGDGNTVTGDNINYSYSAPGDYNVRVDITDSDSNTTSAYSSVISITADGAPEITALDVTRVAGADPELDFDFSVTVTGGAPPYTYNWDFDGDGSDDSTDVPPFTHTYPTYGFYEGILTVTDSVDQSVVGNFVADARTLSISSTDTTGLAPHIAMFEVGVTGLLPGETLTVNFGDSTSAELTASGASTLSTAHTYDSAGAYTAQAVATRNVGGTDYVVDSNLVTINVAPQSSNPYIQLTMPIVPLFQQNLEVHGYNFGATQGSRTITLDGLALTVMDWNDNVIKVEYPESFNSDQGVINIFEGGSPIANPIVLTVGTEGYPVAVQNIIPALIEPGGRVFIVGHGFGTTPVAVEVNNVPVTIDGWSEGAITGVVSDTVAPGTYDLEIDFSPSPLVFSVDVIAPTGGYPILANIDPSPYMVGSGDTLTLSGGGFGNIADGCLVFADAMVLPHDSWSDTSIELFDMLPSVETFCVVINHQRCSNPRDMEVNGAPVIELLSPDHAAAGDMINVYGHSFGETQETGYQVLLGTTELIVQSWSRNSIVVELPTGVADGDLTVMTHMASNAVPFDVIPPTPGPPDGSQI